jgi:HAD superfamily hydrolase (TIGR01509 family)
MKDLKAIIFDMDGVIVDSEPIHEQAFRQIFEEMGYGQTHGMEFQSYYGRSDRSLWIDFVAKHRPAQSLESLIAWKQARFIDLIRQAQPVFSAVEGLLEKLAPKHALAIASGSNHQVINEVLAMRNLRRFFPIVVSVQDVPRGKPAPDVFLRAAALLNVPPEACCVIEDAAAGVEAALAAGMTVIAITNSLPAEKLLRASHVVTTYAEIERLLLPDGAVTNVACSNERLGS